jgi:epoxyqueuosine reductase
LANEAERLLDDESPLVRGAAVWALSQLLGREEFATLAVKVMGAETNDGVREEWQLTRTAARPSS